MKKIGMFLRFTVRRTWMRSLFVTAVCAVFIYFRFNSLARAAVLAPTLGLFIAVISAIILWNRKRVHFYEVIDCYGNRKRCPRCNGDLLAMAGSTAPPPLSSPLTCGGCEARYELEEREYCLPWHYHYTVITR